MEILAVLPSDQANTTGTPASWEERSASRVFESSRGRVLERSRRFVQAASELVARNGFEGLTLRAVFERSRLSRRAFYERFDGKDDLILAVFEQTLRSGVEELRTALADVDAPLERLRFIIEAMVMGAQADAAIRGAVAMSREHMRLADERPDDLHKALSPLSGLISEQLALGMERGVVRDADPDELAELIRTLVSATIHSTLLSGMSEDDREAQGAHSAAAVWEFCRRAVRADEEGS